MAYYEYKHYNRDAIRNIDLDLFYCGTEACTPGHSFGPGFKDHHKIHYIHEGQGILRISGKTYKLGSHQAFLIYPNTLAYYKADENDPWRYSWVAFDGLSVNLYLDRIGFSPSNPVITYNNVEAIERDLAELLRSSEFDANRDVKLVGLLYVFISTLINERDLSSPRKEVNDYISKAVRFIEKNYTQDLRVEQMADYICLERKYFSKMFKLQTGLSPKEFLIRFRMKKACALMKNPDIPIRQVSMSVGYADPLLFSHVFKTHNGCSPRDFKSKTRMEPEPLTNRSLRA